MVENTKNQMMDNLRATQNRLCGLLEAMANDQDWQPEPQEWSFRSIAAHLATVDKECYLDRVLRISAGENPFFKSYFNADRDFSLFDLRISLQEWKSTRREIFDLVNDLPQESLMLSGTHDAFGRITVLDVLKMMLDHDQEHIQHLELLAEKYRTKKLSH
jgi:hypothetical protein